MDVREKLVEILKQSPFEWKVLDEWWWEEKIKRIADHLISNGVTVQEWISVKERLPQEKLIVLFITSTLIVTMMIIGQSECVFMMARNFSLIRHIKSPTGCRFQNRQRRVNWKPPYCHIVAQKCTFN